MKKSKKILIAILFVSSLFLAFYSFNTNTCMRKAAHHPPNETMNEYKRFKHTEDAMKEFGKYVPLPKDEPYLVECTFGEVTYADGEPVQFTHYVKHRMVEMDVRKGSKWEYNKQLSTGIYYYHVSKEPFEYSLETSELKDTKTVILDDGVEALLRNYVMEWKDDRFYYRLYYRAGFRADTLTFLANSSRFNVTNLPEWVNEIK
ncbi:hypothetical protein [Sporosarcina sp. UB5]|uniref:hypothetical protein n=1 Tax=Sporosarcina sp. UB5 TaxID=3047463 RepID=UPI003D78D492